ncbi:hypothetical protein [uncultured Tateyamaria sp.]|uniref:DUF6985 domain-containing protein n=1 Tax=uncultured Tateyamaria sp. TaxID=455651 RepID=UPI00262D9C52|nr:hypothetical protein [uncultured Tateyamaria sp.]
MSVTISLPLFDGASVALLSDLDEMPSAARDALGRLEQLTPEDRLSITPHVYAYYLDMHTHADSAWIDDVMARPGQVDDIWKNVRPVSITVKSRPANSSTCTTADPLFFVLLEANCDWDDEDGLLLSWKDGQELVKVGDYDDKPVHTDPALSGVIYHSPYDDSFSTFHAP